MYNLKSAYIRNIKRKRSKGEIDKNSNRIIEKEQATTAGPIKIHAKTSQNRKQEIKRSPTEKCAKPRDKYKRKITNRDARNVQYIKKQREPTEQKLDGEKSAVASENYRNKKSTE